jgi:hypothetical protein
MPVYPDAIQPERSLHVGSPMIGWEYIRRTTPVPRPRDFFPLLWGQGEACLAPTMALCRGRACPAQQIKPSLHSPREVPWPVRFVPSRQRGCEALSSGIEVRFDPKGLRKLRDRFVEPPRAGKYHPQGVVHTRIVGSNLVY